LKFVLFGFWDLFVVCFLMVASALAAGNSLVTQSSPRRKLAEEAVQILREKYGNRESTSIQQFIKSADIRLKGGIAYILRNDTLYLKPPDIKRFSREFLKRSL
jgi:hypothetical protein